MPMCHTLFMKDMAGFVALALPHKLTLSLYAIVAMYIYLIIYITTIEL